MPLVKHVDCFYHYHRTVTELTEENEDPAWDYSGHNFHEVDESIQLPTSSDDEDEPEILFSNTSMTMEDNYAKDQSGSPNKSTGNISTNASLQNCIFDTKRTKLNNRYSQASLGKVPVNGSASTIIKTTIKLNKKKTIQASRNISKMSCVALRPNAGVVLEVLSDQNDKKTNEPKIVEIKTEDVKDFIKSNTTGQDNLETNKENETNASKVSTLNSCLVSKTPPPPMTCGIKKPIMSSNVNSRIPVRLIRRSKSISRRKSFLKKGDGAGLLARKKFLKQAQAKTCEEGGIKTTTKTKDNNSKSPAKVKSSFLSMTKKNEATNLTFVTVPAGKSFRKSKTKRENSMSSGKSSASSVSKTSRKHWNEPEIKSFEKMILSSILAFSGELKVSTENINMKIKALYDSINGKTKQISPTSKKPNPFAREWRKNNEDMLNSSSQEIAGIFRNLRKVELNLQAIEEAVTAMNKISVREQLKSPSKVQRIVQKGK